MKADDVGTILILLGLAIFLVAVIAIFRPLPRLWMATRKAALIGLAFSAGSCVMGASILPPPEEAEAAATKSASLAAAKSGTSGNSAAGKQAVLDRWRLVLATVKPCDKANSRLSDILNDMSEGNASIYEAYEAAERGADICRETWSELGQIKAPDGIGDQAREELAEALGNCRDAYLMRHSALETAQSIFDGDVRPSAMSKFKEQASTAQSGVMACVTGYIAGALKAGVEIKEFQSNA